MPTKLRMRMLVIFALGVYGAAQTCDSDDQCSPTGPCRLASCDISRGECRETLRCDDGNPCTSDKCSDGVCTNPRIRIDDPDNLCTDTSCSVTDTGALDIEEVFLDCAELLQEVETYPTCYRAECQADQGCYAVSICESTDSCKIGTCNKAVEGGECVEQDVVCPPSEEENACIEPVCIDGACQPQLITCDDGLACTLDNCDPEVGCLTQPLQCPSDNLCNVGVCVEPQGCQFEPIDCDDNNACTEDTCDPIHGCINTNITYERDGCIGYVCIDGVKTEEQDNSFCDDGKRCTEDVCLDDGFCINYNACEDDVFCTEDVCRDDGCTQDGCVHIPVNDLCPSTKCHRGVCDPHLGCTVVPRDKSDGDPCTHDFCDKKNGIYHTPVICAGTDAASTCAPGICVPLSREGEGFACELSDAKDCGSWSCVDGHCSGVDVVAPVDINSTFNIYNSVNTNNEECIYLTRYSVFGLLTPIPIGPENIISLQLNATLIDEGPSSKDLEDKELQNVFLLQEAPHMSFTGSFTVEDTIIPILTETSSLSTAPDNMESSLSFSHAYPADYTINLALLAPRHSRPLGTISSQSSSNRSFLRSPAHLNTPQTNGFVANSFGFMIPPGKALLVCGIRILVGVGVAHEPDCVQGFGHFKDSNPELCSASIFDPNEASLPEKICGQPTEHIFETSSVLKDNISSAILSYVMAKKNFHCYDANPPQNIRKHTDNLEKLLFSECKETEETYKTLHKAVWILSTYLKGESLTPACDPSTSCNKCSSDCAPDCCLSCSWFQQAALLSSVSQEELSSFGTFSAVTSVGLGICFVTALVYIAYKKNVYRKLFSSSRSLYTVLGDQTQDKELV